jgi:Lrp/AsnC family leucine-responsive transcriptional regulator
MRYMLDSVDSKAIQRLSRDARESWADLGAALGLSAPAAAERVRRLQERGIIRGFTAVADPEAAGFPVLAFVAVTLDRQDVRAAFLEAVRRHPLIQECHHVAGDDDFLLKVRARTMRDLERLLAEELKGRLGVARTRTTIVLGTAKETTTLPIAASAPPAGTAAAGPTGASRRRARRAR